MSDNLLSKDDVIAGGAAELMMRTYAEWLNEWGRRNDEPTWDETMEVGLDDFWAQGTWLDPEGTGHSEKREWRDWPVLQVDAEFGVAGTVGRGRYVQITCTPYHDEGGPAMLCGWFEEVDEESRIEEVDRITDPGDEPELVPGSLDIEVIAARLKGIDDRAAWRVELGWRLDRLIQVFDTELGRIYEHGSMSYEGCPS